MDRVIGFRVVVFLKKEMPISDLALENLAQCGARKPWEKIDIL